MPANENHPSNPVSAGPTRPAPYASVADTNRTLDRIERWCRTARRAELGGLSPDQLQGLLRDHWRSPNGTLRLDASLTLEEVGRAPLFIDALLLLNYLDVHGPLEETAAQNLTRSDVRFLWGLLQVHHERYPGTRRSDRAAWNEADVYWLAPLRHALAFAGLIARRSGFRISSPGRELLHPERAGELYARLFLTAFRHLNLRLLDCDRHHGLQATVAYTLYRLGVCARDWVSPQSLVDDAWLSIAQDPRSDWDTPFYFDSRYVALVRQVLEPLTYFRLLETRTRFATDAGSWPEEEEYRVTPLHDRFLRFKQV